MLFRPLEKKIESFDCAQNKIQARPLDQTLIFSRTISIVHGLKGVSIFNSLQKSAIRLSVSAISRSSACMSFATTVISTGSSSSKVST